MTENNFRIGRLDFHTRIAAMQPKELNGNSKQAIMDFMTAASKRDGDASLTLQEAKDEYSARVNDSSQPLSPALKGLNIMKNWAAAAVN